MTFKGTILKVFFSSANWASIRVELEDEDAETIIAAGTIYNPTPGYKIIMEGDYVVTEKYGKQIKVKKSEMVKAEDKKGITSFLSSNLIKGIGSTTAELIYKKFGKDSLKILDEEPEKLLCIKGISKAKLEMIVASYQEHNKYQEVFKILGGNVTPYQVRTLIEKYGKNTINVLKNNPYQIIYDVSGFGFLTVDNLAKAAGIKDTDPARIGAAIVFVLQNISIANGHCFTNTSILQEEGIRILNPIPKEVLYGLTDRVKNTLQKKLYQILDNYETELTPLLKKYKKEEFKDLLEHWYEKTNEILSIFADVILEEVGKNHLYVEEDDEEINVYLKYLYNMEKTTAERLTKLIQSKPIKKITNEAIKEAIQEEEELFDHELGSEQKSAIQIGVRNRISIITGGPGRGKTTIIKLILNIWNDDSSVLLCAPTGRAAQRMKESTGRDASTIHRMIGMRKGNPPNGCLIIVDESSMIDIELAYNFLKWATEYNNNIIFVGDADQLPSVGPGNFFSDIILSKYIPTAYLTKCYRNSGSIANNAERINNGLTLKSLTQDDNFVFIEANKEDIQNKMLETYDKLRNQYQEKDICILSPMKKSNSGTVELNNKIRDKYNPQTKKNKVLDTTFRIGDRIMLTKNNSKKTVIKYGVKECGVYNGDCGVIIEQDKEDGTITVKFDDERIAIFDKVELGTFLHAYSMTIHKSQGSEYATVIIAMTYQHYIMLKRNLLYTAETRAKEKVYLIGEKRAIDAAIRDTEYKKRNSKLRARLSSLIENK